MHPPLSLQMDQIYKLMLFVKFLPAFLYRTSLLGILKHAENPDMGIKWFISEMQMHSKERPMDNNGTLKGEDICWDHCSKFIFSQAYGHFWYFGDLFACMLSWPE